MPGHYQFLPDLAPEERAELVESIRVLGVLVPVLTDPDGQIIDGHHRVAIAAELGVDCPTERVDHPEAQLRSLAFELNAARRHLSREQKRELLARSLQQDPQLSDREHGRRTGTGRDLAGIVRAELEAEHQLSETDSRRGADGRTRTAPAGSPVSSPNPDEDTVQPGRRSQRRRKPLPEQARDAGFDLRKAAERIERLTTDDRLPANRKQVTLGLRGHLVYVAETVTTALAALDTPDTPTTPDSRRDSA